MNRPDICVVIPTRDRETRLVFAMEALAEQTLARERFEVIVVRDEGAPRPRAVPPPGLPIRELEVSEPTASPPPHKRNLGWRASKAPLVAFLDDDCRPLSGWLEQLLAAAPRDGRAIVQGWTGADPDESGKLHPLARTVEVDPPSGWFETCNIAYSRELLERVGGFYDVKGWFGDDTDLGLRAVAAGGVVSPAPAARVHHAVFHRGPVEAIRDQLNRGHTAVIIARHPSQRRQLMWGVFTRADHPLLLIAGAGVALSHRNKIGLLLTLPYLRRQFGLSRLRTPWGLVRMPMQLTTRVAVDLAGIAGGLRGSLRHRSLVI